MKKIGIFTYYRKENPGTFLQAYCLLCAVQNKFLGCRVELIDCNHEGNHFRFRLGHLNVFRLWDEYRQYRIHENCRNNFLARSTAKIVTNDFNRVVEFINAQHYDLILVGSDTVLHILQVKPAGDVWPNRMYWLSPQVECKKIICAASSCPLKIEQIDKTIVASLAEAVADYALIGVRDESTYNLIKRINPEVVSKMQIVPDPTFSMDIDVSHADQYLSKHRISLGSKCLCVSMSWRLAFCKKLIDHYQGKGYKIVSLGYNKYADICLNEISPFVWAGIFKYFSACITDRFHGSIFCMKNNCPVVGIDCDPERVSAETQSKVYLLMKQFGMERTHYLNLTEDRDETADLEFIDHAISQYNPACVQQQISLLKRQFLQFLDKIDNELTGQESNL